ncbi:hypothetical protein JOD47_003475 [Arthrobacter tumbae]|nr:hypothetical protein [Arthrobacter tumbae]
MAGRPRQRGSAGPESRDQSATVLLATVNGLSLELITLGTPAGVEAAHHALGPIVDAAVVGPPW